ncbi:MAG: Ig-like domain-containing protein, partial [Candidatus Sericytochromatia bacterium]
VLMMMLKRLAPLALALSLVGCAGTGINTAPLYKPTTGTITLAVDTQEPGVQAVEFQLDNSTLLGTDEDPSDGWSFPLDTTAYDDGIHYVKAFGLFGDGSRITLLDNTILIDNGGGIGTGTETGTDTGNDFGTDTGTETGTDAESPTGDEGFDEEFGDF